MTVIATPPVIAPVIKTKKNSAMFLVLHVGYLDYKPLNVSVTSCCRMPLTRVNDRTKCLLPNQGVYSEQCRQQVQMAQGQRGSDLDLMGLESTYQTKGLRIPCLETAQMQAANKGTFIGAVEPLANYRLGINQPTYCFSYRATSNHRQKHAGDPSGTGACRQSLPSVKPSGEGFVPTKAAAL